MDTLTDRAAITTDTEDQARDPIQHDAKWPDVDERDLARIVRSEDTSRDSLEFLTSEPLSTPIRDLPA